MKVYEGGRSLDGAVVTVDGAPLDPRFDIHRFSRTGFEWTYEGDGRGSWRSRCLPIISVIRNVRWL